MKATQLHRHCVWNVHDLFASQLYRSFDALVCVKGDLPPQEFFERFCKTFSSQKYLPQKSLPQEVIPQVYCKSVRPYIIAADGAAHELLQKNIHPNVVVGDGDSIDAIRALHPHSISFIDDRCEHISDITKALYVAKKNNQYPLVLGAFGGPNADHILKNIHVLFDWGVPFLSHHVLGQFLRPIEQLNHDEGATSLSNENTLSATEQHHTLQAPLGTKVSFVGAPYALVTVEGCAWPLQKRALHWGSKGLSATTKKPFIMWSEQELSNHIYSNHYTEGHSWSNYTNQNLIRIAVHEGQLLLYLHLNQDSTQQAQ